MKNILFVCTGNSCRSVMAEGLFRLVTAPRAGDFWIYSAGISALEGYAATKETVQVMAEKGVDVSRHRSKFLTEGMISQADEIFVMEQIHKDWILRMAPEVKDKIHLLAEYASKDRREGLDINIPDPIRMSDQFYKNVAAVIEDCVNNLAKTL